MRNSAIHDCHNNSADLLSNVALNGVVAREPQSDGTYDYGVPIELDHLYVLSERERAHV